MPHLEDMAEDDSQGYDKETHGETCDIHDIKPPVGTGCFPAVRVMYIPYAI
jgi:hypothetical protein